MSEALQAAKALSRKVGNETHCWVKLSLLDDLIDEIDRLEADVAKLARPPAVTSVKGIAERLGAGKGPS